MCKRTMYKRARLSALGAPTMCGTVMVTISSNHTAFPYMGVSMGM